MRLPDDVRPRHLVLVAAGLMVGFFLTALLTEPYEEIGMPHPPVRGGGPYEPTVPLHTQEVLKPLTAFAGLALVGAGAWRARDRRPGAALLGLVAAGSVAGWFAFYERDHLEAVLGVTGTFAVAWWLAARAEDRPFRLAAMALQVFAVGMALFVADGVTGTSVLTLAFAALALGSGILHATVHFAPEWTRIAGRAVLAAWAALFGAIAITGFEREPAVTGLLLGVGLLVLATTFLLVHGSGRPVPPRAPPS